MQSAEGQAMRPTGVWTEQQVAAFLEEAVIPIRLAVGDETGGPLVLSVWFVPDAGGLWCATNRGARLIRYLESDPRCGFEIAADAPPYRGVRGQGQASLHPEQGEAILRRLLSRYAIDPASGLARMLLAKAEQEVAIRITPERLTSWDFSRRMQGATKP
jgi:nitroimidazol reductase NimA-like FMN-containing flavoprotein (pyridoxamine 5'-phosphate oxidase superfamily)